MNGFMAEKNRLTVLIDGKEYTIVSEQPKEHIQAVALCADTKMREVSQLESSKTHSTAMIAVLTTLNLAEDYINIKNDYAQLSQKAEAETAKLMEAEAESRRLKELLRQKEQEINSMRNEIVKLQTILKTKGISHNG